MNDARSGVIQALGNAAKAGSALRQQLNDLDAYRTLVFSEFEVTLPQSLTKNQDLAGLFFGDKSLPSSVSVTGDLEALVVAGGQLITESTADLTSRYQRLNSLPNTKDPNVSAQQAAPLLVATSYSSTSPTLLRYQQKVTRQAAVQKLDELTKSIVGGLQSPERIPLVDGTIREIEAAQSAWARSSTSECSPVTH